ncbi:hypothetical protein E1A91_A01G209500v1 [Gossypium mustelinum]|uniref:Uncharacterized protein n=1 Tax=Gossypium mustelinum TaxID=34275 RepID=A0A5D3AFL1_GOSMU|nr:hypothetical protein E1A91_A01G209500v1 [Gossypium mustelinum]
MGKKSLFFAKKTFNFDFFFLRNPKLFLLPTVLFLPAASKANTKPSFASVTTNRGPENPSCEAKREAVKLWRTRGIEYGRKHGARRTGIVRGVPTWGLRRGAAVQKGNLGSLKP